jgi:hypothetical protein
MLSVERRGSTAPATVQNYPRHSAAIVNQRHDREDRVAGLLFAETQAEEIIVADAIDAPESEVTLLGTGIGGTEGRLRLEGSTRLVFTDRKGNIRFDQQVADLHSVDVRGTQLHVWQGDVRHRFVFAIGDRVELDKGILMTLTTLSTTKDSTQSAGQEVDRWSALLAPLVGAAQIGFVPAKKMGEKKVAVILVGVLIAVPAIGIAIYALVSS